MSCPSISAEVELSLNSCFSGRKIEVNDAIVHVQSKRPKRAQVQQTEFPIVLDGTTHYSMPIPMQPYPGIFQDKILF